MIVFAIVGTYKDEKANDVIVNDALRSKVVPLEFKLSESIKDNIQVALSKTIAILVVNCKILKVEKLKWKANIVENYWCQLYEPFYGPYKDLQTVGSNRGKEV